MERHAAPTVWVFGYGSLCWKPGFEYVGSQLGRVRGYSRRFWQGNTAHRGTQLKPGRVATLVEDPEGEVWGVGFEVEKDSGALEYLRERECSLGGYVTAVVEFQPVEGSPVDCLAYLATAESPLWLGPAQPSQLAAEIASAVGPAGSNAEYLLRLAEFLRERGPPAALDPHLVLLETMVRALLKEAAARRGSVHRLLKAG